MSAAYKAYAASTATLNSFDEKVAPLPAVSAPATSAWPLPTALSAAQLLTVDINLNDFELTFPHGETANVQSKAQAFQTLMAAGMHPELAAEKSGISSDPVKDMKMSEKWLEMVWGNPEKVVEAEQTDGGKGEAVIVEEDRNNGMNETGGSV